TAINLEKCKFLSTFRVFNCHGVTSSRTRARGWRRMGPSMEEMMQTLPLRIGAGQDLRAVLDTLVAQHHVEAAFVLQGIGSLSVARLRFAGRSEFTELRGDLEIITLGGSLSPDGPHL